MKTRKRGLGIILIVFSALNTWGSDDSPAGIPRAPVTANTPVLQFILEPSQTGPMIPDDFIGLGYEKTLLGRPGVFAPENVVLRRLLTNLGRGNLRIGANGADLAGWSREPRTALTGDKVVTADDLDRFYAFVRETGWNVVHALNLRSSKPEIGADEADYAATRAGDRLVAFEIGNEPDLKMRNRYVVADYLREFRAFAVAVRAKVPGARFVGPGATYFPGQHFWSLTRGVDEWAVPFAREAGPEIVQLTLHMYILGQPYETGPEETYLATIPNLLGSAARDRYIPVLKKLARAAEQAGVSYRINESNSCPRSGMDGVSNVYASALWAADYLFTLAQQGAAGVNFHGGTQFYTPIETREGDQSRPRPLYYGMLMFHVCSRGRLIPVRQAGGPKLAIDAYATAAPDGSTAVAIINREFKTDVTIQLDATRYFTRAKVLRLEGPALDAKTDVKFGGSAAERDGSWTPASKEIVTREERLFTVRVPAVTAAAILLERDPITPPPSARRRKQ